jgi:hypothetical protein
MDIFFQDPSAIPLPPDEVKIVKLRAEPWPDKQRIKVHLELTPFLKRPNGEISLIDAHGVQIASVDIIESIETSMDFTLHLRGVEPAGDFIVSALIYYIEDPFSSGEEVADDLFTQNRLVVDRTETTLHM